MYKVLEAFGFLVCGLNVILSNNKSLNASSFQEKPFEKSLFKVICIIVVELYDKLFFKL